MSERDGFVERLSIEEARAEIVRLDGLLREEQQKAIDAEQNAMLTVWMILWSIPTHQVRISPATQHASGEGRPQLDRRDDDEKGGVIFTARLLP